MNRLSGGVDDIQTVSEALVVVDLVDSTKTITRHGWYAVGRYVIRDLRACLAALGAEYGLCCRKFTGDGYMLAFNHETAAALATVQAFYSMVATSRSIATLNTRASEQRQIRLRFALHYGEVDAVEGDREGPTVSYTFRLAAVSAASLKDAYSPMPAENFPTHDYIILSQRAVELLQERGLHYEWEQVGLLSLKGFEGYHQLYLVRNLSALTLPVSPDGGI